MLLVLGFSHRGLKQTFYNVQCSFCNKIFSQYEPSNCRWATKREQNRNTRVNRRIEILGTTLCLVDWLIELKVSQRSFYRRVNKGMSDSDALLADYGVTHGTLKCTGDE